MPLRIALISVLLAACGGLETDPNVVAPIDCATSGDYSCDGQIMFDAGPPVQYCVVEGLPGHLSQDRDGSTSCQLDAVPVVLANPEAT